MTLSSALRLVCGQLLQAEYYGRYTYEYIPPVFDDEGNLTAPEEHIYTQTEGKFQCGLNGAAVEVLPLENDLDALFAKGFKLSGAGGAYTFRPRQAAHMFPQGPHTLDLTVEEGAGMHPAFPETVKVTVEVRSTGVIRLTAELGEDSGDGYVYTMEAELTPNDAPEKLFVPSGHPAVGENRTQPMKWTLGWIAKKEA